MAPKFLEGAYDLDGADATKTFYDDWSATYEAEVSAQGYVTPKRCAAALKKVVQDRTAPVLDVGCGTGLGGLALKAAGFTTLDGADLSAEMLDGARAKTGLYRNLIQGDLNDPLPVTAGDYAHMSAIGVLNPGHAPAETMDDVLAKLPAGGCFVFSLNDHALADSSFEARIREHCDTGNALMIFKEYGDHLPGIGLKSTVYVLRKT